MIWSKTLTFLSFIATRYLLQSKFLPNFTFNHIVYRISLGLWAIVLGLSLKHLNKYNRSSIVILSITVSFQKFQTQSSCWDLYHNELCYKLARSCIEKDSGSCSTFDKYHWSQLKAIWRFTKDILKR